MEGGGNIDFLIYTHPSLQEEGGAGGGWRRSEAGVGGYSIGFLFKATHSIWQEMRCSEVAEPSGGIIPGRRVMERHPQTSGPRVSWIFNYPN